MQRRRLLAVLALALVLSLALVEGRALAECIAPRWGAHSLTTLSTTFPRTGPGLVVAMELGGSTATLAEAEMPPLNVTRGRRTSWPLTPVPLAPGLYRVPFDAHVTRGVWTLHGLGPDATLTLGAAAMPGVPVRPGVRQMRRVAATGMSARGEQRIEVRADLEFPVPEGVVASIVTWNTDATPAAWSRATVGQTEMVVYSAPGRCGGAAPGWTSPPDGTLVARLSWVDRYGQVSPASDAITVQ